MSTQPMRANGMEVLRRRWIVLLLIAWTAVASLACGPSDAQRTWCADHLAEVDSAAVNLGLQSSLLGDYEEVTGPEIFAAIEAGEVVSVFVADGQMFAATNRNARIRAGNFLSVDDAGLREAVVESLSRAGLSTGTTAILDAMPPRLDPLTEEEFGRACAAAFEAR